MLNKTMIALSAAIVLGSASATFAYEAPENKIGDRYPALEQRYPVLEHAAQQDGLNAYASARKTTRKPVARAADSEKRWFDKAQGVVNGKMVY